ncbi:MAG: uracil-DNA glycosylase [Proteobacteria bacterium]|nr:uracil-DNA glycosylase [Pseudomonadota bacterium]
MDALVALRLQIAFGADEALDDAPVDRLGPSAPAAAPRAVPDAMAGVEPGPRRTDVSAPGVSTPGVSAPGALPAARAIPAAAAAAADLAAGADSLPALRAAIARFDGCALSATAANLVFAEGDPGAGLLLIGGAPSDADDRAGRPFTGPAGAYLDKMLASIGLDRSHLLLAPLVPWRPPGDRPPSPAERAACRPFLHRLIVLVRPRRLVLLGPLAVQDLLGPGRRGKEAWRAVTVPPLDPIPALATQDPGILVRSPGLPRRRAWAELRLLRRGLDEDITKS